MVSKGEYRDFEYYLVASEPSQREAAYAWITAIGLQAVDGLSTSDYLQKTARRNIEGEITIDEARNLINQYYVTKAAHDEGNEDKEEADRVSSNIVQVLASPAFDFSSGGYKSVHRRIFKGVMKHAGELRTYDITKKEWVLEGDTVLYLNWEDLQRALDYDLGQERAYNYAGKSNDEIISHLTRFVSGLWQIHAFREGNTRATAVFIIQYLRSLGFDVSNALFSKHSWYFRNALVRANYHHVAKGIDFSPVYLERFFRNLLLGEEWDLRNRYLHIHPAEEYRVQPNLTTPQGLCVSSNTPNKYPTSTQQAGRVLHFEKPNVELLIVTIGTQQMSVKQIMEAINLKDRVNFLKLYLAPAMADDLVRMLFPESPRHPRQKYLLTEKGLTLYNQLSHE